MDRWSLFIEQLMLVVSGVVLVIIGLRTSPGNQTFWYQGASGLQLLTGAFLVVIAPSILYMLHRKLYDSDKVQE